jgi:predicted transcriptional regulator
MNVWERWRVATYSIGHNLSLLPLREKYNLSRLPWGKKYRSNFEITALILEAVKDGGEGRFAIMKRASVNCTQLEKLLSSLVEIGFIETYAGEGRILCRATEKGLAFLRQYYVLLGMLLAPQAQSRMPTIVCEAPVRR